MKNITRNKHNDENDAMYEYLRLLRSKVIDNPKYTLCQEKVDMYMDDYNCGQILGISPTRENFDNIYDLSNYYRGGLQEIKVGDDYVIYGFEFD